MSKVKVKSTGDYEIKFMGDIYNFKSGEEYELENTTVNCLIDSGHLEVVKDDTNKSKKTNKSSE